MHSFIANSPEAKAIVVDKNSIKLLNQAFVDHLTSLAA